MVKVLWWILGLAVAALVVMAIVSTLVMILQVAIYVIAFIAVAWALEKIRRYIKKHKSNKPPE